MIKSFTRFILVGGLLISAACRKELNEPPLQGKWQYQVTNEFTYDKSGAFLTQQPSWQSPHFIQIGPDVLDYVSVDDIVTLHLTYARESNTLHLRPLYPGSNDALITELTDHKLVFRFEKAYANPFTNAYTSLEHTYTR